MLSWPPCIYLTLTFIAMVLAASAEIEFQTEPKDQAIVFGQDLFLHCAAVNSSTGTSTGLLIQWRLNGSPLSGKASMFSNYTLLVPGVTVSDLGNYTCVVLDDGEQVLLESSPAAVSHAFIKMFEVNPDPVTTFEDKPVSFACVTGESAPPPVIFWERNGEPFYGGYQDNATYGGDGSLSIVRQYSMILILTAKPYLDGTFNCVARNPVLNIDVRSLIVRLITIEIESPPYVMEDIAITGLTTAHGQPMIIDCPVAGKPQVAITWFKDEISIDNFPSFLLLQNGSLYSPMTSLEDEGLYYCEGTNILGSARSPNITVIIARLEFEFIREPPDLYLIAGLPATMSCIPPISVPPAYVTWYKDDALLVPRTGEQTLTIVQTETGAWNIEFAEVQKQDEGLYFCVANNDYAVPSTRTSRVATLQVGGAPIFIEPPTGLTITKGDLAKLVCYVQGDPFPKVTWLFENRTLEASDTVSFREYSQELWIGNIHKEYEGTFTCMASNRYGTTSTRVYVKVLVPPVIMRPVGHTTASANEATVIPCVVYSDPVSQITWYKDDAALRMGGRFTQIPDGLYITSVETSDAGTYICEARNIAGSVESSGTLSIQVTPHFITKPENEVVTIGRNVTLTCVANGYPKPEITWLFNDSSLFPKDSFLSLDGEKLFLLGVSWLHVGEYTCRAENKEGLAFAMATVKLQIPPKIDRIEGVPLLYQQEDLNLRCHITGIPTPEVEWQKNREPLRATQNGRISFPEENRLRIMFVSTDDTGLYTCKVTNPAGVSQRDIQVHIIVRPSPPVLYRADTTSATSVELAWSLDQVEPQTPVEHVLVYFRKKLDEVLQQHKIQIPASVLQYEMNNLDPASEYIFMVAAVNEAGESDVSNILSARTFDAEIRKLNNLDPASEYIFMIAAVNEAGESDVSNILSARTFDAGPSEPRNLEVITVTANNVTLRWEIPFVTNGEIKWYKIQYAGKNSLLGESDIKVSSSGSASQSKLVPGLKPYTWYSFQVQGATMEGDAILWGNWSETVEIRTQQAAPDGSPREVKALALTIDTIHVSWEAVLQERQNGPIKRYHIRYWLLSNMSYPLGEEVIDSLDLRVNISGLDPWRWYAVEVFAENEGGEGTHSNYVTVRTLPAAPSGAPINVSVEALSSTSLRVSWLPPHESQWNSDLAGYMIEYWELSDVNTTLVRVQGHSQLFNEISDLNFWTDYEIRVAAYTDQLVDGDGVGPFSENVTGKTLESVPTAITDLTYISAITSVLLSWKPPMVTNGDIQEYLIQYFSMGSAEPTTPAPSIDPSGMVNFSVEIFNDSKLMGEIFNDLQSELTLDKVENLMVMCVYILTNETIIEALQSDGSAGTFETDILQNYNLSNTIIDWFTNENQTVLQTCNSLQRAAEQKNWEDINKDIPAPVVLVRRTKNTQLRLTDLLDEHIYNVSVSAATAAGYGEVVFISVTTLQAETTKKPTTKPTTTTRKTTSTGVVLAAPQGGDNLVNLPVIVGGGVAGLFLILFIFFLVMCAFLRRWRNENDEKVRVISKKAQAYDDLYGQLDRPRSSQLASAAADGTDSSSRLSGTVDIYGSEVRFQSPTRAEIQASDSSFMTEQSRIPSAMAFNRPEAFLGMDNPSYSGTDRPGTVKSNPTYREEPSASDMESMSVSMTLSAEDLISQGDSTLKRKSRMRSSDAAAIARLRSSNNPGLSEQDTSSLIHNEVEVIYNERTAL